MAGALLVSMPYASVRRPSLGRDLDVVKLGSSWRIQAERPHWDAWKEQRQEQAEIRMLIADSLSGRTSPDASFP